MVLKANNPYQIAITGKLLSMGYTNRDQFVWECVNIFTQKGGKCQLCGHFPITYHFVAKNKKDGKTIVVGSECISNIHGIDPDQAKHAVDLYKQEYARLKKEREAKLKEERRVEYQKKYKKEFDYLDARSKVEYINPELFNLMRILETGKKTIKPEEIELIRKTMKERPIKKIHAETAKEKVDELVKAIGGKKEHTAFTKFVKEKRKEAPENDFWFSMEKGLENLFLTENQIAAVKRQMDRKKGNGEPIHKNVVIEIPRWLAAQHGIAKVVQGDVIAQSAKAYLVKGHAVAQPSDTCLRCGLTLTHPISLKVGYGAECCEKLGIPWEATAKDIKKLKKRIEEIKYEGWLPKSRVTFLAGV